MENNEADTEDGSCDIIDSDLNNVQSPTAIINEDETEEEIPDVGAAWSETGCIICNDDMEEVVDLAKSAAQIKEQNKLKSFFIEVMAVGQNIRLEEDEFFPFCPQCSQEVSKLMGIGYKIDFMHKQFDKARDSLAAKCVKTFLLRTDPELVEEDEEIQKLPYQEQRHKVTNRGRVLEGWKKRYEVVQPGPKNPVMIRSMDSRGRVTVVRINSKGEAILPPERFPKRGGIEVGRLKRWEENHESAEDGEEEPVDRSPFIAETNIYSCPDCPKTFNSQIMLTYHSRLHSGILPFECELCGKGFAIPQYLVAHMRGHTGEKPFKCQDCGKGFAQRGGLATHALVHTGEKPYSCKACGKSFRQKYHLTQHLLIHSGAKPYPCDICGKSFNVKMNLREHMRRHTGDRPYKCPYCTVVGFFRKKMLRDHISKAHSQRSLPEELLESNGLNIPLTSLLPETITIDEEILSDLVDKENPESNGIAENENSKSPPEEMIETNDLHIPIESILPGESLSIDDELTEISDELNSDTLGISMQHDQKERKFLL